MGVTLAPRYGAHIPFVHVPLPLAVGAAAGQRAARPGRARSSRARPTRCCTAPTCCWSRPAGRCSTSASGCAASRASPSSSGCGTAAAAASSRWPTCTPTTATTDHQMERAGFLLEQFARGAPMVLAGDLNARAALALRARAGAPAAGGEEPSPTCASTTSSCAASTSTGRPRAGRRRAATCTLNGGRPRAAVRPRARWTRCSRADARPAALPGGRRLPEHRHLRADAPGGARRDAARERRAATAASRASACAYFERLLAGATGPGRRPAARWARRPSRSRSQLDHAGRRAGRRAASTGSAGDEIVTTTEEHPGILSPLDVLAPPLRRGGARRATADDGRRGDRPAHADGRDLPRAVDDRPHARPAADRRGRRTRSAACCWSTAPSRPATSPWTCPRPGADYYAFSGQKWLLGPLGSGGLWVHPDRIAGVWPAAAGLPRPRARRDRRRSSPRRATVRRRHRSTRRRWPASPRRWSGSRRCPAAATRWIAQAAANAAAARERLAQVPGARARPRQRQRPDRVHAGGPRVTTPALAAALAERGVLVRFIPGTP